MKTVFALAASMMMTGCGGTYLPQQASSLPDTLQVGYNLLSRDTVEQTAFPVLTVEMRDSLARLMKINIPAGSQLLGERSVKNGISLEAFKVPMVENPNLFRVYLVTRTPQGKAIDWIDLHEFHTSEYQGRPRLGGNRYYTTDAELRFDDALHFTLHRVMTLTSIFLKDHRLTEMWRVEWDNHYEIDETGHFIFKGQEETSRTPNDLNDPMIDECKSRDHQE